MLDRKLFLIIFFSIIFLFFVGMIVCDEYGIIYFDEYGVVDYVIDGDTIVMKDGSHIRYIGIDTPEKNDCYGKEATNYNKNLVENKRIKIRRDKENKDKFGRLLRYVYIGDLSINELLVSQGYATAFEVKPNNLYADKFKVLENNAKNLEVGLWKDCK